MKNPDDIVGHKTFREGGRTWHEPLTRAEGDALWAACEAAREKRAADMPDVQSAINAMMEAHTRLKELGWREAIYSPKDRNVVFEVIEPGSAGIHKCIYDGEQRSGRYWILSEGDMSPSHPVLFRPLLREGTGE